MQSENTMNTTTMPPAPRISARLILMAAVWAGAILLANPKQPADANTTAAAPATQQVAIEVVPSAGMSDLLHGQRARLVAHVSVQQHANGTPPTVSVEVGTESDPAHVLAQR